jgi:hypothetical protein
MSDVIATPVRTVPTLTPEKAAGLPGPRPYGLRQVAAALAAVLTFAALVAVEAELIDSASRSTRDVLHFAAAITPWLLTLPWLRHLDLRPVPWFFLCLVFWIFAAPLLVGRVVSRALALPYRDWPVEYWHASRARNVPGVRAWTIVPADEALPYHRPPAERALQAGWSVEVVTAIPVLAAESGGPAWVGYLWLSAVVALVLATYAQYRVDRRRLARALDRVVPQADQPDDR